LDADETSTEELSSEQLQERLTQQETYIQELKGSHGTVLQRLDAAAAQVVELQGRLGEQRDILARHGEENTAPKKDPWELDDSTREEFQNQPDKIVDFTKDRIADLQGQIRELTGQIASVLESRDGAFESRLEQIRADLKKHDPERMAYEGAITELKKDPALADLADEKLIAIAKRTSMKPDYEPSGGPGSPVQRKTVKSQDRRSEAEILNGFMQIYGDRARAETATKHYMAKRGVA